MLQDRVVEMWRTEGTGIWPALPCLARPNTFNSRRQKALRQSSKGERRMGLAAPLAQ